MSRLVDWVLAIEALTHISPMKIVKRFCLYHKGEIYIFNAIVNAYVRMVYIYILFPEKLHFVGEEYIVIQKGDAQIDKL